MAVQGLEDDDAVAELTAPAGLLLVTALRARFLADRLQVGNPRLVQLDLDVEAALQTVDGNLDVDLREPGQQLLARLRIATHLDRRILLTEPAQSGCHLFFVALRLRRDGEAHHGLREADVGQLDLPLGVQQHVAGLRLLQLGDGTDVALAELRDLDVLLALQLHQLSEPLLGVRARR